MHKLVTGIAWSALVVGLAFGCGDDDGGGSDNTGGRTSGGRDNPGEAGDGNEAGADGTEGGRGGRGGTGGRGGSGGTGNVSSGDFSSGLPGSTPLNDLTSSQIETLCEAIGEYMDESTYEASLEELGCRAQGLFAVARAQPETDEEAQEACQLAYDECMAAPNEEPTSFTGDCTESTTTECTATVAEYEACVEQFPPYFEDSVDALPQCEGLTLEDLETIDEPSSTLPPACAAIEEECPGEFGGEGGANGL